MSPKLGTLILSLCLSLGVATPGVPVTSVARSVDSKSVSPSAHSGGREVIPTSDNIVESDAPLTADGTSPVPPVPKRGLTADVPSPAPRQHGSKGKETVYVADGTSPVPPVPQRELTADGTSPVPPVPRQEGL